MKRMWRRGLAVLLVAGSLLTMCACGDKRTPGEYLRAFARLYPLPAGRLYDSMATEGKDGYLTDELFSALYAREDGTDDRGDICEYALFLGTSSSVIYEMGIFNSPDRDAAFEVVGMIEGRLTRLREMTGVDATALLDATVTVYGTSVIYTVLPDNAKAQRTLDRMY